MPTISFGPPGHRGVTRLLAVGDTEYETPTDRALSTGLVAAGAVSLAGIVLGSSTVRTLGIGAAAALLGVRYLAKPKAQVVAAAPTTAAAGW